MRKIFKHLISTFLLLVFLSTLHAQITVNGGGSYPTIQAAVNAASNGDVIDVPAGIWAGANVNKVVTVRGVGDGSDAASNTIINSTMTLGSGSNAFNRVVLENLRINTSGSSGIGSVGSYTTLRNLTVTGNGTGINCSSLIDLKIENSSISGNVTGLRMGTAVNVDGLTVSDSQFDNNNIGWYNDKAIPTFISPSTSNVTNVNFYNTTFNNNLNKGIYVEKLSNAIFYDLTVNNSGTGGATNHRAGIDINLKYGNYENIYFYNLTISNSGKGDPNGGGILIKARTAGGPSSSYTNFPATLNNVNINYSSITNNGDAGFGAGIRIGESNNSLIGPDPGPTNVNINYSTITGNTMHGVRNATSTQVAVNATCNWWGSSTGPTDAANPGGTGDAIAGNVLYTPWATSSTDTDQDGIFDTCDPDDDNDGVLDGDDCAPLDPNVGGPTETYYQDNDGDGYGDNNDQTGTQFCTDPGSGWSSNNSDCNDNDATVHQPQPYYKDNDGDGNGAGSVQLICSSTAPAGYSSNNWDSDDTDGKNKVYVCHNGKSLAINQSAMPAHLAHGDNAGPCPTAPITKNNAQEEEFAKPSEFKLSNYPNPFNNTTRIQYTLPVDSRVSIKVFDLMGREIATLVNGEMKAGAYAVDFDASKLSKGVYYYRLTATAGEETIVQTKNMSVVK